jgi:hypothetical protein
MTLDSSDAGIVREHKHRQRSVWGMRQRSIYRARQSFIAANPREGRVMRQVRRALVASLGRPLRTRDLLN